jgi:hypothetical protein
MGKSGKFPVDKSGKRDYTTNCLEALINFGFGHKSILKHLIFKAMKHQGGSKR